MKYVVSGASAIVAACAIWWVVPRVSEPSTARLNVLIVTLDTTRADRLGAYGDSSHATSHFDQLARDGVVFERAIAPAPLTLPAHATIFTGVDPPFHGVRDNGGYLLAETQTTLAEVLRAAGWATGAFVGAFVVDSKWGLDQGFDEYVDRFDLTRTSDHGISIADISRPASEVVDATLSWLGTHTDRPFFAWVHFYDAHAPYEPPEPWRSEFASRPYLGEIAYADAQLGRVIAWLRDRGLLDRTVVVVVGDHGESLGEHSEGTHGLFVYDATVRVPLVVRAPGEAPAGTRIPAVVRSQDVMPTVLALVGVDTPPAVRGRSLVPLMTQKVKDLELDAYSESLYAQNHFGWAAPRALRAGRYKVIDAPRPELYDLDRDPAERSNVFDERRALGDRLLEQLRRIDSGRVATSSPAPVDAETRARLAALGYVSSSPSPRARAAGPAPDPKDKIAVFNQLLDAQDHPSAETLAALQRIVKDDPQIIDAWTMLGNEYFRRESFGEAVASYQQALVLKPDSDLATINLANAYRRLGQDENAMLGYRHYLERDPRNAYVHYQLGEVQADRGLLSDALESFSRALDSDPSLTAARVALGAVRIRQGDLGAGEREIRAALEQQPGVRLALYNLALIAEHRSQWDQAEQLYERELDAHPDSFRAAFNLGRLYERRGDRARQISAWRRALSANPRFSEGHIFLAKVLFEMGEASQDAFELARRGVDLDPQGRFAALGYYVMADLRHRQGNSAEAAALAAKGRALESRGR
ncbi:MAG: sulfatase-like hydrolase/transferase [Vicinamibacterales bacterium]